MIGDQKSPTMYMARSSDLTVLLTLRGRHLHTLRWLWHANRVRLPYHVVIADGEVHPTIYRLLKDPGTFPFLSYEYRRYNDSSYGDFYRKCVDSSNCITTKYMMMSDNDDYLITTGIKQSVAHLETDDSYVAAGGKIPSFEIESYDRILPQVFGKLVGLKFAYGYQCNDLNMDTPSARVLDAAKIHQVLYYHVYRTDGLNKIFQEIEALNFSDLTVHEYYCALRAATLGKIKTNPSVICYLRQRGTSSGFSISKDWVNHLLHSSLPQDFRLLAKAIAAEIGNGDPLAEDSYGEELLDIYAQMLRKMLGYTMMRHRFPKLFRIKQKLHWIDNIRLIPVGLRNRVEVRNFWAELSADLGDSLLLPTYKTEIDNICSNLQDESFLNFVKNNASDLICQP
jgi:glycosyltransferase domain-containing protein